MYVAVHRREPEPTTRGWRTPLVLLIALATMVLPISVALAAPGAPGAPDEPGQPGAAQPGAAQPGAAQPGAAQPGKPAEKPEPVWTGVPGTNLAHDSYGYPWPAAPDCDESNVGTGGCVSDSVGFFQGQCTSWVAFRLGQRNGIAFSNWFEGRHWGNASEWSRVAKALGYTSNKVPAVGAVGWYARGHVSYVEEVNADGSVVISEMNTDGHNGFVVHTVYPAESSWPDRFLHVADVVPVDLTAPERPLPLVASAAEVGVEVSWKPPADNVAVTGYRVLRNGMPLAATAAPSYVDRQASPGQAYTYSVVAHDEVGNVSAPATTVIGQNVPARPRQRGPFLPDSAAVVAAGDDSRIWFCRVLGGERAANACLPLDLATQSWGFDRVDQRRTQPASATWVTTAAEPTRCGTVGDRATCSVLLDRGWRTRTTALGTRPGDPLSRAFVGTGEGTAFCRNVQGRARCTELDVRRLAWGRAAVSRAELPHGRWLSRPAGPTLCLQAAGCRTLPRANG